MRVLTFAVCGVVIVQGLARAQTPPEIGYIFPPSVPVGQATEVRIGGYNWTPDMQTFPHDPRVRIELTGPGGPVLVPEPPYWFGKKARDNDFPLPREFPAKITIPADVPPGLIKWQAANANGATTAGVFLVTAGADTREQRISTEPQVLPALPCAVIGQVMKLEEVDRYEFTASRAGPITLDLWTRRLQSKMNAILEVRDTSGRRIADATDTTGHDPQLTFAAKPGERYTVHLFDVDFRGHPSFVYRLVINEGPNVRAAIPCAGRPGEARPVEFIGLGLQTGHPVLESPTRDVTFPTSPSEFEYRLETPFGSSLSIPLSVTDRQILRESDLAIGSPLPVPVEMTGVLSEKFGEDRFTVSLIKEQELAVSCRSVKSGPPLDLVIAILDSTGKELVRCDDQPGTIDCDLSFTAPADGSYVLSVTDVSGQSGRADSAYQLTIEPQIPGLRLTVPEMLALPLGGKTALPVKIIRSGGLADAVAIQVTGLPPGCSVPADLVIPAGKTDLKVEVSVAPDSGVSAAVLNVSASASADGQPVSASASCLAAITMKSPIRVTPEGLDDVRKWPRGSTYPAPVLIERTGYDGEFLLEQTAHQQRVRQGLTGPDFFVPAGATRVEYPVFLPEWLETTKTSRIILNSVVQVPDPKGTTRHLLQKMELRIGMLPVGALLKISEEAGELVVPAGTPFEIPVALSRSAELKEPATLALELPRHLAGKATAEPVTVAVGETSTRLRVVPAPDLKGEHEFKVRATVHHQGSLPVRSETAVIVEFK